MRIGAGAGWLYRAMALAAFSICSASYAMWVGYSDEELIAQSGLIVQARFIGTTEIKASEADAPAHLGVLEVDRVIKGDPGVRVVLLVLRSPQQLAVSTDLHYRAGQAGLWFLYQRPAPGIQGVYYADHPQRFLRDGRSDAAADRLRKRLLP